jgi:hypothetical protein
MKVSMPQTRTKLILYPIAFATLISLCAFLYLYGTRAQAGKMPTLRNGDIIFQTSTSSQSTAIMLASRSVYSHMGIIRIAPGGNIVVVEAAGPVRETPLQEWMDRGVAGRVTVKRLPGLTDRQENKILSAARQYYGRAYDVYFFFDNDTVYCSELVYDAYKKTGISLGKVEKIGDLHVDNPAAMKLLEQRGQSHPLCRNGKAKDFETCRAKIMKQDLITPASIAADPKLETIYSNY